ncbi:hypothetical protein ACFWP5_13970 [Streptomyces sp. NPDC058469]|uniref:hypothetical protein n=1 Tax=Streptomyces sp. NPDC058469 TaxID=3346514 RepID=UPI0036606B72
MDPVGSGGTLIRENHEVWVNPGLLSLDVAGAAVEAALGLCAGQPPGTAGRVGSGSVRRTPAQAKVQVESAYLYGAHAVSGGDTPQAHVRIGMFKRAAKAAG